MNVCMYLSTAWSISAASSGYTCRTVASYIVSKITNTFPHAAFRVRSPTRGAPVTKAERHARRTLPSGYSMHPSSYVQVNIQLPSQEESLYSPQEKNGSCPFTSIVRRPLPSIPLPPKVKKTVCVPDLESSSGRGGGKGEVR